MNPANDKDYRESVFEIVRLIPQGRVMTYGQIAGILGEGYTPRTVGYVMHAADSEGVPWQRVINAGGRISSRGGIGWEEGYQRHLLEEEGVVFNESGRIDLERFGWDPDEPLPTRRRAARRS